MSTESNPPSSRPQARPNSALCAGAATRMLWAVAALSLLWLTIHWALS